MMKKCTSLTLDEKAKAIKDLNINFMENYLRSVIFSYN